MIQNKDYVSKKSFDLERDHLFKKYWMFCGLKTFLSEHNSYITKEIGGINVLIQNIDGRIVAMENRCPHRSAVLQDQPYGKRSLTCKIHGWRIGGDGKPFFIPNYNDLYKFTQEEINCTALKLFSLEFVGNFIFLNMDDNPITITEQIPREHIDIMRDMSSLLDTNILVGAVAGNFNWKLGIEIIMDSNHVQFLHNKTLAKAMVMDIQDRSGNIFPYLEKDKAIYGEHIVTKDLCHYGEAIFKAEEDRSWFNSVEQYGNKDETYYDLIIFPNLHIVSATGGRSFQLYHYVPVSEGSTRVDLYMMTTKHKEKIPTIPATLYEHFRRAMEVLSEDIYGLEQIHNGMANSNSYAMLGEYESYNKSMKKWFSDFYERSAGE